MKLRMNLKLEVNFKKLTKDLENVDRSGVSTWENKPFGTFTAQDEAIKSYWAA